MYQLFWTVDENVWRFWRYPYRWKKTSGLICERYSIVEWQKPGKLLKECKVFSFYPFPENWTHIPNNILLIPNSFRNTVNTEKICSQTYFHHIAQTTEWKPLPKLHPEKIYVLHSFIWVKIWVYYFTFYTSDLYSQFAYDKWQVMHIYILNKLIFQCMYQSYSTYS